MSLHALTAELERNLDVARSTRNLITEKRDMLQGDVKQRLVLHQFHTDVWDMVVNRGDSEDIDDLATVAACYERLKETNEMVQKFNAEGDAIVHSPLIEREGNDYGREHVVDIMKELCEEAESFLHEAYAVVEEQLAWTCPTCGQRFETEAACEEHVLSAHTEQQ